jgi:hypothetical protein
MFRLLTGNPVHQASITAASGRFGSTFFLPHTILLFSSVFSVRNYTTVDVFKEFC